MEAERLAQVEEIYHAALEVSVDEWPSFLSNSCGDNLELRREVESLLSFTNTPLSLIDNPPTDVAADLMRQQLRRNLVGKKIRHYRILSQLGSGGMGDVFLATDTALERKVAIKILSPQFSRDSGGLRRLVREAKAASALNHPNIITVYEIRKTSDTPFIATEFIEGKTLRQAMDDGEMTFEFRVDVVVQVASALVAAHSAGILHRDIKPENIMLRPDGLAKVLDFGLAKAIEDSYSSLDLASNVVPAEPQLSTAGLVMGTLAYMSPEQAAGEPVDARADIWSLGVVMFELFYRRKPFPCDTVRQMRELLQADSQYSQVESLPGGLEKVISKALRKDPRDRYQDAATMLSEIKAVISRKADQIKFIDLHANQKVRTKSLGFNTILVSIALFVVFLAVVGGYFYNDTKPIPVETIAVLPFQNETGDPELEYLSDALSEALIDELSQLTGIKVIARDSAFNFRGGRLDLPKAGQDLGVQAVVTGRVTKSNNKLNVRAQLTDVNNNSQIWGGSFDRKLSDLFQIQGEMLRGIAAKLRLELTGNTQRQLAEGNKADPIAYEMLVKGHFYRAKGGTENSKKAIDLYLQALAIDKNYGSAYASLAGTYLYLGQNGLLDPKEMTRKARTAAERALELDENSAEAHLAMAGIRRLDWNWAGAEDEYRRAIELNPNLAAVRFGYSFFLTTQGRHDEAVTQMRLGRELDPLKSSVYANIAYGFYFARQYDKALEQYNINIELDPTNGGGYYGRGLTLAAQGRLKEAISDYREMLRLSGDHSGVRCFLGSALARDGQLREAKAILRRLENGAAYVSPFELAILYVAVGQRSKALDALERAYEENDSQIQYLLVEPGFDDIRSDSRFISLLRNVSLPI